MLLLRGEAKSMVRVESQVTLSANLVVSHPSQGVHNHVEVSYCRRESGFVTEYIAVPHGKKAQWRQEHNLSTNDVCK